MIFVSLLTFDGEFDDDLVAYIFTCSPFRMHFERQRARPQPQAQAQASSSLMEENIDRRTLPECNCMTKTILESNANVLNEATFYTSIFLVVGPKILAMALEQSISYFVFRTLTDINMLLGGK